MIVFTVTTYVAITAMVGAVLLLRNEREGCIGDVMKIKGKL